MSKVFLVSDTHFYHKNIIKYADRPFKDVEEMNSEMIKRWNSVVRSEDTVYHLGDFIFASQGRSKKIFEQLNGTIHLIRGNHDRDKSDKNFLDIGFQSVSLGPVEFGRYVLTHHPIFDLGEKINIHGHIHERLLDSPYHINISVEYTNYTPIQLSDIPRIHKEQMSIESGKKITIQRYKEGLKNRKV